MVKPKQNDLHMGFHIFCVCRGLASIPHHLVDKSLPSTRQSHLRVAKHDATHKHYPTGK